MSARNTIDVVFIHGLFSSGSAWDDFERIITNDPELADSARTHRFEYPSPKFRVRPDRRIATVDDIADRLRTYLRNELADATSLVLVTHSQGGMIAQRYLARTLWRAEGHDLSRIKHIVMFACPNTGSEFFLAARKQWYRGNPQEQQLRPFNEAVLETQRTLLRAVVHATGTTDSTCRIPISAIGGLSDRVVPPVVSTWVFPQSGLVNGDHFSVIRPADAASGSYRVLRTSLKDVLNRDDVPVVATNETVCDKGDEGQARVPVAPPFGRRTGRLHGRRKIIASIIGDQRSRVQVLVGMGGTGKSRVALEIAHQAVASGHRVWWIEVQRLNLSMRQVASQLNAPANEVEAAWQNGPSAPDLVWRLLDASPDPWLLVFDNADDAQLLDPDSRNVSDGRGWLREPTSPRGRVLVTSQEWKEEVWGSWCAVIPIPPLTPDEGGAMLVEHVGAAGGSQRDAKNLATKLGGLPLALWASAQYLSAVIKDVRPSSPSDIRTFQGYLEALEHRFQSTAGPENTESLGLENVVKVFMLSLDLLNKRDLPWAAPMLKLFACLNVAPIPYQMLLNSVTLTEAPLLADFRRSSQGDYLPSLEALAGLGLVELQRTEEVSNPDLGRTLTLHPLVHVIMRRDPDVLERRDDYYGLDVEMLLRSTDGRNPDETESWPVWNTVVPHSSELIRAFLLDGHGSTERDLIASALDLARSTTRYLIVTGILNPGFALVNDLITECAGFGFEQDDPEILDLRHERGRIALERGLPDVAEAELEAVLDARIRVLGRLHPRTLASMHKHAKAIAEQGRWAEAEPLLRAIVDAEQVVNGPEHTDMMVVKHSLARTVLALKRPTEAERMMREILAVRHRKWNERNPETLSARRTLAQTLNAQRAFDEAETELRAALDVVGHRSDAREALALRYSLYVTLLGQGRVKEVLTGLTVLLDDQMRALGPNHPVTDRTRQLLTRTQDAFNTGQPDQE